MGRLGGGVTQVPPGAGAGLEMAEERSKLPIAAHRAALLAGLAQHQVTWGLQPVGRFLNRCRVAIRLLGNELKQVFPSKLIKFSCEHTKRT